MNNSRSVEVLRQVLYALADTTVEGPTTFTRNPCQVAGGVDDESVLSDIVQDVSNVRLRVCVCQLPENDTKRRAQAVDLAKEIVDRLLARGVLIFQGCPPAGRS